MKIIDWRTAGQETQEIIRKLAVANVENGESQATVIRVLDITKSRLAEWLNRYRSVGEEGLDAKPRIGRRSKLTEEQEDWLIVSSPT